MLLIERLVQHLIITGPQSTSQLLSVLPELDATSQAQSTLHLLLRLDRRVKLMADGRWTPASNALTSEERIVFSARTYLSQIPGGGAPLSSTVERVVADTGFDRSLIQSVITQKFVNNGRAVRNQLKQ